MKNQGGRPTSAGKLRAEGGESVVTFPLPPSPLRLSSGMTLIELMVVIVILLTLVAGVLPLVSPNNDARKIGEASRALQTYFMQAQAEAARIGRPVGVGFRETTLDSGVALEAFQMVVPPVYPGSSTLSRVKVAKASSPTTYGMVSGTNSDGNSRDRFPNYDGATLYAVHTQLAIEVGGSRVESLPPNMFQVGDIIEAEGHRFVIVDDARNKRDLLSDFKFLVPSLNPDPDTLICVRLDEVQQGTKVPPLPQTESIYTYGIHRQPMGNERTDRSPKERIITSGESPFQMPAGVAIDLQASGMEGQNGGLFSHPETDPPPLIDPPADTSGIMFSPNGGVDSVWVNGERFTDASRVFFLLGRVENGNPEEELYTNWGDLGATSMSAEEFEDRQAKVNWLNPDSRWMMINGNDGRLTFHQNALVDPRTHEDPDTRVGPTPLAIREAQIEAAHGLAHGRSEEEDVQP